jgi:hypothetical protein
VFQPLAQLAAEHHLAVLAITHLRKTEGAAIQRAAGSMGYVAAARAVWTVCRDQTQPGRHLFLPIKNNFVAETSGLAYTIDSVDFSAPKVTWQQEAITTTAAEALTPTEKIRGPEAAELNLARKWLREELADGPVSALHIYAAGTVEGGFHERTLRRALDMLGGETKKISLLDGWEWSLPNQQVTPPLDPNPQEPDSEEDSAFEPAPPTNLSTSEKQGVFDEEAWLLPEHPNDFDLYDPASSGISEGSGKSEASDRTQTLMLMPMLAEILRERMFAEKPPPT